MLGLADRSAAVRPLRSADARRRRGRARAMAALYAPAPIPPSCVQDLLELTHWLTRIKLVPAGGRGAGRAARPSACAAAPWPGSSRSPMLARVWQMLLKGLGEVQSAPLPLQAAEMVLIRLTHAADLPTPADLVRQLQEGGGAPAERPPRPGRCRAIGAYDDGVRCGSGRAGAQRALGPTACLCHRRRRRGGADRTGRTGAEPGELRRHRRLCSASGARPSCRRISRTMCTSSASSRAASSSVPTSTRRASSPTAWAPCSRSGPAGAGWSRSRASRASRPWPSRRRRPIAASARRRRRHPLVQAALAAFPGATIEAIRDLATGRRAND